MQVETDRQKRARKRTADKTVFLDAKIRELKENKIDVYTFVRAVAYRNLPALKL